MKHTPGPWKITGRSPIAEMISNTTGGNAVATLLLKPKGENEP